MCSASPWFSNKKESEPDDSKPKEEAPVEEAPTAPAAPELKEQQAEKKVDVPSEQAAEGETGTEARKGEKGEPEKEGKKTDDDEADSSSEAESVISGRRMPVPPQYGGPMGEPVSHERVCDGCRVSGSCISTGLDSYERSFSTN